MPPRRGGTFTNNLRWLSWFRSSASRLVFKCWLCSSALLLIRTELTWVSDKLERWFCCSQGGRQNQHLGGSCIAWTTQMLLAKLTLVNISTQIEYLRQYSPYHITTHSVSHHFREMSLLPTIRVALSISCFSNKAWCLMCSVFRGILITKSYANKVGRPRKVSTSRRVWVHQDTGHPDHLLSHFKDKTTISRSAHLLIKPQVKLKLALLTVARSRWAIRQESPDRLTSLEQTLSQIWSSHV